MLGSQEEFGYFFQNRRRRLDSKTKPEVFFPSDFVFSLKPAGASGTCGLFFTFYRKHDKIEMICSFFAEVIK